MYSFLPHVNRNRADHGFSCLQGSYWAYRNESAADGRVQRDFAAVSRDITSDETDCVQGTLKMKDGQDPVQKDGFARNFRRIFTVAV